MNDKNIFESKTMWVNAIAMLALLAQSQYGFVLDADAQIAILSVINIILRFVTKGKVNWGAGSKKIISILFVIVMLSVCSSAFMKSDIEKGVLSTASKILLAKRDLIITIAELTDQRCTLKYLNQDQCDKARTVYEKVQPAYDTMADILIMVERQGNDETLWAQYVKSREDFMRVYIDIYNLAVEFGVMKTVETFHRNKLKAAHEGEYLDPEMEVSYE